MKKRKNTWSTIKGVLLGVVGLCAVTAVGAFAVQAMPIQTTPNTPSTNTPVTPEQEKPYSVSNEYVTVESNISDDYFSYSFRNVDGEVWDINSFSNSYVFNGADLYIQSSCVLGYTNAYVYVTYPDDCSYEDRTCDNTAGGTPDNESWAPYYPGMKISFEFVAMSTASFVLNVPEDCSVSVRYRDYYLADGTGWYVQDLSNVYSNVWLYIQIFGPEDKIILATLADIKYCDNGSSCGIQFDPVAGYTYTLTVEYVDVSPYTTNTFNFVNTDCVSFSYSIPGGTMSVDVTNGWNNAELMPGKEYYICLQPLDGYALCEVVYNGSVIFSGNQTESLDFWFVVVENGEFYASSILTGDSTQYTTNIFNLINTQFASFTHYFDDGSWEYVDLSDCGLSQAKLVVGDEYSIELIPDAGTGFSLCEVRYNGESLYSGEPTTDWLTVRFVVVENGELYASSSYVG